MASFESWRLLLLLGCTLWRPRIGSKKNFIFFSALIFSQFLVNKALDPDWIRIRIGIQPKMLDPDPDEMNADPQPCLWQHISPMPEVGRVDRRGWCTRTAGSHTLPTFPQTWPQRSYLLHPKRKEPGDKIYVRGQYGIRIRLQTNYVLAHGGTNRSMQSRLCWIKFLLSPGQYGEGGGREQQLSPLPPFTQSLALPWRWRQWSGSCM